MSKSAAFGLGVPASPPPASTSWSMLHRLVLTSRDRSHPIREGFVGAGACHSKCISKSIQAINGFGGGSAGTAWSVVQSHAPFEGETGPLALPVT